MGRATLIASSWILAVSCAGGQGSAAERQVRMAAERPAGAAQQAAARWHTADP